MTIQFPKNQITWVTYFIEGVPKYLVTSDKTRDKYILYKVEKDGGLTKLKTSIKPLFKEVGNYG